MKHLDGVLDARVNFGASKITVLGNATIEEIEKAGAFENLKLRDEKEQRVEREPFWKTKRKYQSLYFCSFTDHQLVLGEQYGEGNIASTIGYAASILIGGYSFL